MDGTLSGMLTSKVLEGPSPLKLGLGIVLAWPISISLFCSGSGPPPSKLARIFSRLPIKTLFSWPYLIGGGGSGGRGGGRGGGRRGGNLSGGGSRGGPQAKLFMKFTGLC